MNGLNVSTNAVDRTQDELKRCEDRLRNIIEKSADGIIIVGKDGMVQFHNSAAEKILDRNSRDLVGEHFGFPLVQGDMAEIQVVSRGGEIRTAEMRLVETEWEGNPACLATLRDITREVKLQQELRQAQKMEAIGTLAGGIAHDFNNILSAIFGYTELAAQAIPVDHPGREDLKEVMKAAERARDLVRQILTFSRQTEQDLKPLNIVPVIKETMKFLRASLPATIEIRQKLRASSGMVLSDPTQIYQVLMNLCTNAAHAMRERGGILEVALDEATLSEEDIHRYPDLISGEYLRLSVSDTGCGILPEHLDRIFDPYFTTKEKGEGTGLGLSVVIGIVKGHKGAATVYTEPGKGSCFNIVLPRFEMDISVEAEKSAGGLTGTGRILFVDDEEVLARVGKKTLERLGYRVTETRSSTEALEIFRKAPEDFDMVITDKTMPCMTGFQLTGAIRQIRQDIPVILCTGLQETDDPEKARCLGIREIVTKPVIMRELGEAVRKALDRGENKGLSV